MTPFVTAGAGFLLAVLWFDLMHDVQVLGARHDRPIEERLASISAYYGRVTTGARPMNRLVAAAMLVTLGCLVAQLTGTEVRDWVAAASLGLTAAAVLLAGARTVPHAVRLGAGEGSTDQRLHLARGVLRDHLLCLTAITVLLVLQLGFAR